MYDQILERMIECIWSNRLHIPFHALVAIEQDLLTVEDLVNCFLSGEIVEQQRDRQSGEFKYVIAGEALDNSPIEVVAKLVLVEGTYVITVYRVY